MGQRKTQLKFYEHRVICPYCSTPMIFHSSVEVIESARRTCLVCEKVFLIRNGEPRKLEAKKAPLKTTKAVLSGAFLASSFRGSPFRIRKTFSQTRQVRRADSITSTDEWKIIGVLQYGQ